MERTVRVSASGKWQSVRTEIESIPAGMKSNGSVMTDSGNNILMFGPDGEYEREVKTGKCFHTTIEML